MNTDERPNIQLETTQFNITTTFYENNYEKIQKGVDTKNGKEVLLHSLVYRAYRSTDLLDFAKVLMKLKDNLIPNFIPFYGFAADQEKFICVYRCDNCAPLNTESFTDFQKCELIKTVAKTISILHSLEIPHFRVKATSIFVSDSNFYLACVSPFSSIDIDPSDCDLPLFGTSGYMVDSFMFGLLIIEIFQNRTQIQILEEFWNFKEIVPKEPVMLKLAYFCTSRNPKERLTFPQILDFLEIDNNNADENDTKTYIGHTNENVPNLEDNNIINTFSEYDSDFFRLIHGFILSESNKKNEAILVYQQIIKNCISLNNLGIIFFKIDKKRAFEYLKSSADSEYFIAQRNFGILIIRGTFKDHDPIVGLSYIKRAALQGSTDDMITYSFDCYDMKEDKDSSDMILHASRKMHPRALYSYYKDLLLDSETDQEIINKYIEMGVLYEHPHLLNTAALISKDPKKSVEYWQKAADLDLPQAQYNLAVAKLLGIGCQRDVDEGARLMKKSAEKKNIEAMFGIAMLTKNGIGVQRNEVLADALCIKASDQRMRYMLSNEKESAKYTNIIDEIKNIESKIEAENQK